MNNLKKQFTIIAHYYFFCTVLGALLYLTAQLFFLFKENLRLPISMLLTFCLTYIVIGFIGVLWEILIKLVHRNKNTLNLLIAHCVIFPFFIIISMIYQGELKLNRLLVSCAFCLIIFLINYLILRKDTRTTTQGAILFCFSIIGISAWSFLSPEMKYCGEYYRYMFMFSFLSLFVITIYRTRTTFNLPFSIELALAVIIVASIISTYVLAEKKCLYWEKYSPVEHIENLKSKQRPNIIFVVWDTVRRDHLSVYGYERSTTPHLNARSKSSVTYTRAVSSSSWTLPSHASMFTGMYPKTHGAHWKYGGPPDKRKIPFLSEESETLAEILWENGYQCGGVCANANFAGKRVRMNQGFWYFNEDRNPFVIHKHTKFEASNFLVGKVLEKIKDPDFLFYARISTASADQVNKRALDWLDSIDKEKPFFLFLNYMDAHEPYYPPADLTQKFPGYNSDYVLTLLTHSNKEELTENKKEHYISQYDACIAYLDQKYHEFEKSLQERNLFRDTFIVIVSDHGEFFGEKGLKTHPPTVYAEGVNVPLLLKYPGNMSVGLDDSLFETRSLFNVVLKEAGLFEKMHKEDFSWAAVSEAYDVNKIEHAVLFDDYKYIINIDKKVRLYNIKKDPHEINDVAEKENDRVQYGKKALDEFQDIIPEDIFQSEKLPLTDKEIKELKALGYIK
jgi:arylsulfatase A-like enzyme